MARTLPWIEREGSARPDAGPRKKRRFASPDLNDLDITSLSTPKRQVKAAPARTPSTSPPPTLSTEIFMREGFDQDDIYIMVEDQFQTIAQSFTQHLHRAEYLRLTKRAKQENALTIHDLSRPTDNSMVMSIEAKRMREAQELSRKQRAGLQDMRSAALRLHPGGADDSEIEKDKEGDPWVGTSLHGLMESQRKSQQALVGLQGVKSTTRAAAGFAKPEIKPIAERRGLLDVDLSRRSPYRSREQPIEIDGDATTSGDDDDLDAVQSKPSFVKKRLKASTTRESASKQVKDADPELSKKSGSTEGITQPNNSATLRPSMIQVEDGDGTKPKPSGKFAWLDDFDDLPDESKGTSTSTKQGTMGKIKLGSRHQSKAEEAPQVTAIPTFLV